LPQLASALSELPPGTILDGELVALVRRPDGSVGQAWEALGDLWWRGRIDAGVDVRLVCFDCLEDAGAPLDGEPWSERRQRLERVLRHSPPMLSLTTLHAPDVLVHRRLTELGFEGSVIKRADSRYARGQRTRAWLKLKQRQETAVVVRFAARDRRTGRLDRAAFTERGVPGLQWAAVASREVGAR